jgi:hypothetical protein
MIKRTKRKEIDPSFPYYLFKNTLGSGFDSMLNHFINLNIKYLNAFPFAFPFAFDYYRL